MSAHPPPVPREQQSDKAPASGRAEADQTEAHQTGKAKSPSVDSNANRFGDIKQNTRNKGHQQDR